MIRKQLIEKGDFVCIDANRFPSLMEPIVLEKLEANYQRLSKEKDLSLQEVRNASHIFYVVGGTEERKNEYGDKELYISIGIGDELVSVPACITTWLYRQENIGDTSPASTVFITFLNRSNFIKRRWFIGRSFFHSRVHDSWSLVIPYHMMKSKSWKGSVEFRRKLWKEKLENK